MVNTQLLVQELNRRCLIDIAQQAGVSYSCLSNTRQGKTKLPQHRTLMKILPVLGMKLEFLYA